MLLRKQSSSEGGGTLESKIAYRRVGADFENRKIFDFKNLSFVTPDMKKIYFLLTFFAKNVDGKIDLKENTERIGMNVRALKINN